MNRTDQMRAFCRAWIDEIANQTSASWVPDRSAVHAEQRFDFYAAHRNDLLISNT